MYVMYVCKIEIFLNPIVSTTNTSADTAYKIHLDTDVCKNSYQWHIKYKILIYLSALIVFNPQVILATSTMVTF